MRIFILFVFILIASASFEQVINFADSPFTVVESNDSMSNEGYFLSLDAENGKLYVPAGNDSLKLYGVKIFSATGEELVSKRIEDSSKPTAIDVSKLPDGNYILHLVTIEQVIYRSKFVFKR